MKKSHIKIFLKSIFITLGALCFVYGLLNPLVYTLGRNADAVCDSIDYKPSDTSDTLYDYTVSYHYFVSGNQYGGTACFTAPYEEEFFRSHYTVKYMPLFHFYGIIDFNYKIPIVNCAIGAGGLALLIIGIFIRTRKKERAVPLPAEKLFLCPICRREIDYDSIYCSHCGRKIV